MTDPAAQLTEQQLGRLRAYGRPDDLEVGDTLFATGDASYDLIVVESGAVELTREATPGSPETPVIRFGAGGFVGELGLLTGQTTFLTGRMVEAGRVHRISPEQFRRLLVEDAELSDLLLREFVARRQRLNAGPAAQGLEIVGSDLDSGALALRAYAARRNLPHVWLDADSVEGRSLMRAASLQAGDLPAVLTSTRTLVRATPGELAQHLGLAQRPASGAPTDLTIIGAGPAGLAAAVYGASEGLDTLVLDAVAAGGQAAASARIENYLGFPSGISGEELAQRAVVQALKFGARLSTPCEVVSLEIDGERLTAILADGTAVPSRAVVIATGARYRALPLESWEQFVGAGIHYAATELEVHGCVGRPVTVVGGANSSGQAALTLAASGSHVTLAIRGPDLAAGMSQYLVDRIAADPRIDVRLSTEVTRLKGERALEQVTLTNRATGEEESRRCAGLFCFIGADPSAAWLTGISVDTDGFIRTDVSLSRDDLGHAWSALGRTPLPFETNVPGVFAAGDVRHGSVKRVAAAVGEGASVVRSVHLAIGVPHTAVVGRGAERPSSASPNAAPAGNLSPSPSQTATPANPEPRPALASQGQGDPQCQ
jgi:thioredoxin reductase (NADPH)